MERERTRLVLLRLHTFQVLSAFLKQKNLPCCLISPCVNWPGAITRRYNLGGLNNRNLLSVRSRGWNCGRAGVQKAMWESPLRASLGLQVFTRNFDLCTRYPSSRLHLCFTFSSVCMYVSTFLDTYWIGAHSIHLIFFFNLLNLSKVTF